MVSLGRVCRGNVFQKYCANLIKPQFLDSSPSPCQNQRRCRNLFAVLCGDVNGVGRFSCNLFSISMKHKKDFLAFRKIEKKKPVKRFLALICEGRKELMKNLLTPKESPESS